MSNTIKKRNINIDDYFDNLEDDVKKVFQQLKEIGDNYLKNYKIDMSYGFPLFDGYRKYGFDKKKNYVSIYFHHIKTKEIIDKYWEELGKFELGKDTLRFKSIDDIPMKVIDKLVKEIFV